MADGGDTTELAGDQTDRRSDGRKVTFSDSVSTYLCSDPPEPLLTDPHPSTVGDRLYEQGRTMYETRLRLQEEQEMLKKKEEAAARRAKPQVTREAAKIQRTFEDFIQSQTKWCEVRRKKQDKKEIEKKAEEEFALKRWEPSMRSEEIIKRKATRGDYQGPISGWKMGFSKYVRAKNMAPPEADGFEPTINITSKQLVREGSTHERLHAMAAEREESLMMLRAWEYDKSMIDPQTGTPRFHPRILSSPNAEVHYEKAMRRRSESPPTSSMISGNHFSRRRSFKELMDHLHHSKTETRQIEAANEPMCTFQPQTNPTSALILERSGPRPPLYQPTSSLLAWRGRSASPTRSVSSSGPVERSASEKRRCRQQHNAFMARQHRNSYDRLARKQELERELRDKVVVDCTFHPQISRKSSTIFETSKYARIGAEQLAAQGRRAHRGRSPLARRDENTDQGSRGRSVSPQKQASVAGGSESDTAAFIRQLESEHARDREAGLQARLARSASPNRTSRSASPPPPPPAAASSARRTPAATSPKITPGPQPNRRSSSGTPLPAGGGGSSSRRASTSPRNPAAGRRQASPKPSPQARPATRKPRAANQQQRKDPPAVSTPSAGAAAGFLPSPVRTPNPGPSPFLNNLHTELKSVIDEWKDIDL